MASKTTLLSGNRSSNLCWNFTKRNVRRKRYYQTKKYAFVRAIHKNSPVK